MTKQEVIFVPGPGISHFVPALEFANRLLNHNDLTTISVLVLKMPLIPFLDSYINSLNNSHSRIKVIQLPEIVYPPQELLTKAFECYNDALMESYKPHVRSVVSEIVLSSSNPQQSSRVAALILDFFCVTMIDIGNEFGIPSYVYLPCSAGFLSLMLSIPNRHKEVGREFRSSDPALSLAALVNPVPVQVLPSAVFNTYGAYLAYVKLASRFRDATGIVVNTFSELECHAVNAISDGQTPPIYTVGPGIGLKVPPHPELNRALWNDIMKWLDEQPQSSVLFLCFGSFGGFSVNQVRELAHGLEKSESRFLWCLRDPPGLQVGKYSKNPEEMLPEGFLERIGKRGIVCGWAPQVEVLGHKAIGGFMSHCGWNSILESLWYGVPIVTLPLFAEQQFNAFLMVKELGLAEELRLDYKQDHILRAEEIEKAVRRVMQSDNVVRKKVKEMRELAKKAVMEGGSSSASIVKLLKEIVN